MCKLTEADVRLWNVSTARHVFTVVNIHHNTVVLLITIYRAQFISRKLISGTSLVMVRKSICKLLCRTADAPDDTLILREEEHLQLVLKTAKN